MADSPSSPPPPLPPPAPTTITALSDYLLREIFLRLPAVTSLARAAFACRAFLHAVRSSPAFRRRFRELRAPPLLALFLPPDMHAIVPATAGKCSDIAAAFADLLQNSDASEWRSDPEIPYIDGYADFVNRATDQGASYSPHSQALNIYSKNFRYDAPNDSFLEFHTLWPDGDEQLPSRVVCIHRDRAWAWARVAVFSSQTMEWRVVLPEMDTEGLLVENDKYGTRMVVNGFVCWVRKGEGCIFALNTATFQFSRLDLPQPLKGPYSRFQLGHTKDGEFCVVGVLQCMLSVWHWAADSDGVKRFMMHKTFSLRTIVSEVTNRSEEADVIMRPMAVINGFVYLCVAYFKDPESPEWFMSLCLETAKVNLLHNHKRNQLIFSSVDPYIMVSWPSSLIHGKEDSDTGVTRNISEDDGPMGTEKPSPVLFIALQSFKEQIIDSNSNFAEIESFLLDDERNSLLNRIAILESGLAAARDRVLRIGTEPNSMERMKFITSMSGLAAARDRFLRIGTESDRMEGMERVSCWQMCKVVPVKSDLSNAAEQMQVTLAPHSFSSFDLALAQSKLVAEM